MKSKPNLQEFKKNIGMEAFLQAGAESSDVTINNNLASSHQVKSLHTYKEQKVFRLPIELIKALKKESYERSMETGVRVTETEIVEEALRTLLNVQ